MARFFKLLIAAGAVLGAVALLLYIIPSNEYIFLPDKARPLAPYVTGVIEGWEQTDGPRSHLREVPIPGVPLIVNLGSKWNIETAGRTVALDSFTGGLSTSIR